MLKAVFFDNDGVLVDTEAVYFRCTRDVLAAAGLALTDELFIELFLRQGRGAWYLLEERGWTAGGIADLRAERNRRYAEALSRETILIDGVDAAVERLHGRVLLGIVTSSRRDHFEIIHRRTHLLPFVDFTLTIEDYARAKPHPDPYVAAIARSGYRPDECLVIEDSERGLQAARAAGVPSIVIPRGLTRHGDFTGAYAVRNALDEVAAEILESLARPA